MATDKGRDPAARNPMIRSAVDLGVFSTVSNLLVLVIPLYLLQVYDRVLPAASVETLIYLTIIAAAALIVLALVDVVRARYANRVAARLDRDVGTLLFLTAMNGPRAGFGDVQPLRDLSTARNFIASRNLLALFDLPFLPVFIVILYFIHPVLFGVTLAGTLVMLGIAALNQWAASASSRAASDAIGMAMNCAQAFARHFESVRALGMARNITELWGSRYVEAVRATDVVTGTNAVYGSISRTLRMLLQIVILGAGAWLVLDGAITAGMIFASSLISARALQPLDQVIGSWPQIVEAQRAFARIRAAVQNSPHRLETRLELPEPQGHLSLEDVVYALPDSDAGAPPLIKRVSFQARPGETVAIIGQSQAGKSTLARLIVGAIAPRSGTVRLDGADIRNWDPDQLGDHIGYLSQDSEIFPGTIAQNISRFGRDVADADIVQAAQRAQVHHMVLRLKQGYLTQVGPAGARLSGGERQRIGLARAFFGDPKLVVLDEPNANLDAEGEAALERAIQDAKARGTAVILITHRAQIAAKCDRILFLRDGQVELFGPAGEVLIRLAQGGAMAPVQPPAEQPTAALREMMARMQAQPAQEAPAQREAKA